MGKSEEEQALYHAEVNRNAGCFGVFCFHCRSIRRLVNTKCLLFILLGIAVLISALFLLPPLFKDGRAGERNWGTGTDGFGGQYPNFLSNTWGFSHCIVRDYLFILHFTSFCGNNWELDLPSFYLGLSLNIR